MSGCGLTCAAETARHAGMFSGNDGSVTPPHFATSNRKGKNQQALFFASQPNRATSRQNFRLSRIQTAKFPVIYLFMAGSGKTRLPGKKLKKFRTEAISPVFQRHDRYEEMKIAGCSECRRCDFLVFESRNKTGSARSINNEKQVGIFVETSGMRNLPVAQISLSVEVRANTAAHLMHRQISGFKTERRRYEKAV